MATWAKRLAVFGAIPILGAFLLLPRNAAWANPDTANYFLTNLPTDAASIDKLAKYQVLVIQPWEALVRRAVVDSIRQKNPKIIILAYVPTKSYDLGWTNYPASTVYGNLNIQDNWWLRDSSGNITSDWPSHKSTNLDPAEVDYLIGYLNDKVFSTGVFDGVFWDVVYDGIAFQNGGDIDLNRDGVRDNAQDLNAEWTRRMGNLLEKSRQTFGVRYVVFNGTSIAALQPYVNGRMYENFPTPWEQNGNWGALMASLQKNQAVNQRPQLYIFNANTKNTGDQSDLRAMRFGLGSSLLADNVYFSYDFGDKNHGQLWSYDEYDAKLGSPAGPASGARGETSYQNDVWRRDFDHGLVIVNATGQTQHVDLGGDFETLKSSQDPSVNDGAVTDQLDVPANDSVILFKTFKTLANAVFVNGSFVRFYNQNGSRARNGFFVFEDQFPGGAKIFNGDLDGDGTPEKIVVTGRKLEIYSGSGDRWYNDYPFGANGKGVLNVAVGSLAGQSGKSLVVGLSQASGKLMIFNYHGGLLKDEVYPLGKKYTAGWSLAIADGGLVLLGTGKNTPGQVLLYNTQTAKVTKSFYPYTNKYKGGVNVASGDLNGDGAREIVSVSLSDKRPRVGVFNNATKKLAEFTVSGFFGPQEISLATVDVNFEGKMEIAAMSNN